MSCIPNQGTQVDTPLGTFVRGVWFDCLDVFKKKLATTMGDFHPSYCFEIAVSVLHNACPAVALTECDHRFGAQSERLQVGLHVEDTVQQRVHSALAANLQNLFSDFCVTYLKRKRTQYAMIRYNEIM
jgi:hypothetical protein